MSKKIIATDKAPKAIGPYSQAVSTGGLIFVSGQLGIDPSTKELAPGVAGQTRQALANAAAILEAAGSDLSHVVKATVLLADMADFGEMNAAYVESFPEDPPARAAFAVRALPLNALVEIEVIAHADKK